MNTAHSTVNDITIAGVSKRFGDVQALDNVSLSVPRGSFLGLLGPNGAGKTTLIGILGGLVRADTGKASIFGCDVMGRQLEYKRQVGIVPQELLYDPFFTVREALIFQSKYFGLHNNSTHIDYLLEKLHLQDKAATNTRRLSGGMKRRLMIAQALVHSPPVIVLDEPTAGVDINLRLTLWDFIRELRANGRTIILTTHYLEEAEELCDTIALMRNGRIVAQDSTAGLLANFEENIKVRLKVTAATALPPHKRQGDYFIFSLPSCDHITALLNVVRDAGGIVTDMEVSRADLEDVFVAMMEAH